MTDQTSLPIGSLRQIIKQTLGDAIQREVTDAECLRLLGGLLHTAGAILEREANTEQWISAALDTPDQTSASADTPAIEAKFNYNGDVFTFRVTGNTLTIQRGYADDELIKLDRAPLVNLVPGVRENSTVRELAASWSNNIYIPYYPAWDFLKIERLIIYYQDVVDGGLDPNSSAFDYLDFLHNRQRGLTDQK